MSGILVLGKIKTLVDRLTQARATNLDNLNASVSSRAPASTALSNGTWTGTKAGYVDAAISTRTGIKSIQRGTITISANNFSNTATITGVVTSKTELRMLGFSSAGSEQNTRNAVRIQLTNSTTVTATRGGDDVNTSIVSYEVIEYL